MNQKENIFENSIPQTKTQIKTPSEPSLEARVERLENLIKAWIQASKIDTKKNEDVKAYRVYAAAALTGLIAGIDAEESRTKADIVELAFEYGSRMVEEEESFIEFYESTS